MHVSLLPPGWSDRMILVAFSKSLLPFALGHQRFQVGRFAQINRAAHSLPYTQLLLRDVTDRKSLDIRGQLNSLLC